MRFMVCSTSGDTAPYEKDILTIEGLLAFQDEVQYALIVNRTIEGYQRRIIAGDTNLPVIEIYDDHHS